MEFLLWILYCWGATGTYIMSYGKYDKQMFRARVVLWPVFLLVPLYRINFYEVLSEALFSESEFTILVPPDNGGFNFEPIKGKTMKLAYALMIGVGLMATTPASSNTLPPYITSKMQKVCAPSVKRVCNATKKTSYARIKHCVKNKFMQLSNPCQQAILDMLPAIQTYEARMAAKK